MKTHIPDHATGRTYCGRKIGEGDQRLRCPDAWPACIDLARDCIESATCLACQRADDRRQVDEYRRERAAALFEAACRWAQRQGATELTYDLRRRTASAWCELSDSSWEQAVRTLEALEADALYAGAL